MRIACIYNTCQISGKDNRSFYFKALSNLFEQHTRADVKICVSGCMMTHEVKEALRDFCRSLATLIWVDEPLPLNVTMNHAVRRMRELHGDFTHYVYMASDVDVGHSSLADLCEHVRGNVVVGSAVVDRDSGADWLGIQPPRAGDNPVRFVPGKTCNLHCQAWSHDFIEKYHGRVLPDIFASDCSEQVTPYLCAAIRRDFVWVPVFVHHGQYMDVASSGFPRGSGDNVQFFPAGSRNIRDLYWKGKELGWGFEEYCTDMNHAREKFDADYYAPDSSLFEWLRDNMFLKDFAYDKIKHEVVNAD